MKCKRILGVLLILSMCLFIIPTRANEIELIPTDDSEVNSYSVDSNEGASYFLHVGNQLLGRSETFIKFNIPTSNKIIASAKIETKWYSFMCDTWLNFVACLVTNDWNEKSITWNNAPTHGEIIARADITNEDNFNFDVTDHISDLGEFSICIYEESPYGDWGLQGDSKEFGKYSCPKLIIVYETTIEDFIPLIIIVVIVISGGIIGFKYLSNRKKKRETEKSNFN